MFTVRRARTLILAALLAATLALGASRAFTTGSSPLSAGYWDTNVVTPPPTTAGYWDTNFVAPPPPPKK